MPPKPQSQSFFFTPLLLLFLLSTTLVTPLVTAQTHTRTSTVVVTVTATPTDPPSSSYTSREEFKDIILKVSNAYRKQHSASPLVWNETLAEYAFHYAKKCKWEHSHGPYGENLATGYPNTTSAVSEWGDERDLYDFKKPTGFTEETGHFTQLVWKATEKVGCAVVDCGYKSNNDDEGGKIEGQDSNSNSNNNNNNGSSSGPPRANGWYIVCEYLPQGNLIMAGRENALFIQNVLPESSSSSSSTFASPTTSCSSSTSAYPSAGTTFTGDNNNRNDITFSQANERHDLSSVRVCRIWVTLVMLLAMFAM